MSDTLFVGISALVQPDAQPRGDSPLTVVADAALWVRNGTLVAAGRRSEVSAPGSNEIDLGGRAVVPGFVDSHTHAVFAAGRIDDFARRCRGETYAQIAAAGGGIRRSVEQLRDTPADEVIEQSLTRLTAMAARGTTTCEVKSGYGLTVALELAHLELIDQVRAQAPIDILPTVLAHVVPVEERQRRDDFIERFAAEVMTVAARRGLARFADVFVESGAFSADEARRLAAAARHAGLRLKLHVDQLGEAGGAALAAELGALSADHLEHTNEAGRRALAAAGVVATILPGCALFMGEAPWPDGRALRRAGCAVAIATDCNPGSSHVGDLALCATLAATRGGLTVEEALWGITRGGALALGLADRGRLVAGERADFVVVDDSDWRALLYSPGAAPIAAVLRGGEVIAGWT